MRVKPGGVMRVIVKTVATIQNRHSGGAMNVLLLPCGHRLSRKESAGIPLTAKCKDCIAAPEKESAK